MKTGKDWRLWAGIFLVLLMAATPGFPQESSEEDLAKKTQNPVADLISLPFQLNYDENLGPSDDGSRIVLNIQPVIPISLNRDWNVISRTIVPLVDLQDFPVKGNDESGIGDVLQSLFFSPKKPTSGGAIWGVGPVLSLPTASDELLGSEKWSAGPTAVVLKQESGWTYGALANHLWSFAGDGDRAYVNTTFLQPFLAYTLPTYTTLGINTESAYDWRTEKWSVPVNISVSQILKIGSQPVSLQAGLRYWAESPEGGPEDLGLRLAVTLLFPK
jgi:hypothetical protein